MIQEARAIFQELVEMTENKLEKETNQSQPQTQTQPQPESQTLEVEVEVEKEVIDIEKVEDKKEDEKNSIKDEPRITILDNIDIESTNDKKEIERENEMQPKNKKGKKKTK
jgi:hypothetical protein